MNRAGRKVKLYAQSVSNELALTRDTLAGRDLYEFNTLPELERGLSGSLLGIFSEQEQGIYSVFIDGSIYPSTNLRLDTRYAAHR